VHYHVHLAFTKETHNILQEERKSHIFDIMGDDAIDEENIVLCCALCCANCGLYADADCLGCSGKCGCCCVNCEVCCKPSAPCLPCGCFGPKIECDGCSILNAQLQCCQFVISAALPCNEEVPVAVSIFGATLYPKFGCCVKIGDIRGNEMDR